MDGSELAEAFRSAAADAARRLAPRGRVLPLPELGLRVALEDGRALSLDLRMPLRAFEAAGGRVDDAPAAAEAHVRERLAALPAPAAAGCAPPPDSYEAARARLLPLLESWAFFERADAAGGSAPRLLRVPVVEGELATALVLPGEGRSMRFIAESDAERWGKAAVLLEHDARRNLAARIRGRLTLALHHDAWVGIEDAPWPEATLALLPDVRARLADALGEAPILALPMRGCLRAFAADERERWEPLLPELARRRARAPDPLSTGLFTAGPDGLRLTGRLTAAAG